MMELLSKVFFDLTLAVIEFPRAPERESSRRSPGATLLSSSGAATLEVNQPAKCQTKILELTGGKGLQLAFAPPFQPAIGNEGEAILAPTSPNQ
jgi:hypothetical protein